jgi:hypothetical protein
MVKAINRQGEVVEIDNSDIGHFWYDGGKWKVQARNGILTYKSKAFAMHVSAIMQQ